MEKLKNSILKREKTRKENYHKPTLKAQSSQNSFVSTQIFSSLHDSSNEKPYDETFLCSQNSFGILHL